MRRFTAICRHLIKQYEILSEVGCAVVKQVSLRANAKFYGHGVRNICAVALILGLSACGIPRPDNSQIKPAPADAVEPVCKAVANGNALVGNWYVVTKQAGVAGEIQNLLTLSADGKFRQQTRVKQGRNIRSELRETGCWESANGQLVTRVTRSNGELVDFNDAIYTTTYIIEKVDANRLMYRDSRPNSKSNFAKKVQDSFRM